SAKREHIKESIQRGDIRLVCATDAASEGLNLQRLGAQINVDLPWNPSRLEQRKGRVQRIGQIRDDVHILSLRYAGTVEDQVYATLSSRFGDIFSVLGQLPDGFEARWIDAVLRDRDGAGISRNGSRKSAHLWSCATCEMLPMIAGSIGNTRSEFCPPATWTSGC